MAFAISAGTAALIAGGGAVVGGAIAAKGAGDAADAQIDSSEQARAELAQRAEESAKILERTVRNSQAGVEAGLLNSAGIINSGAQAAETNIRAGNDEAGSLFTSWL